MADTPQEGFFANIMSLMSQDSSRNQEYIFTDRTEGKKTESTGNIIQGMPVIFSAQVIDDSESKRFGEKNRRSILITPNTDDDKLRSAIQLMGKKGLLPEAYDEQVVSRADQKLAREIVEIIVEKLIAHSEPLESREYGVEVPFHFAIANSIPLQGGVWSMTVMKRTMLYLSIITKTHMDQRPRIVNTETGAFYPISTFEDLKETLTLMERGASNIRAYLAKAYNDAILPAYKALDGKVKTAEDRDGRIIAQESHCGQTTEEIAQELHERLGIPLPGIKETYDKYLKPLSNHGLINYSKSVTNGKENLWYPVDEKTNAYSLFSSADLRLEITDPSGYPDINVLEQNYGSLSRRYAEGWVENKKNNFRLLDVDDQEITVDELLEKYYQHPEICFRLEENGGDSS